MCKSFYEFINNNYNYEGIIVHLFLLFFKK